MSGDSIEESRTDEGEPPVILYMIPGCVAAPQHRPVNTRPADVTQ